LPAQDLRTNTIYSEGVCRYAPTDGGLTANLRKSYSSLSCCAFKLGMGSDQDGRITKIPQLLIIGFKCVTA